MTLEDDLEKMRRDKLKFDWLMADWKKQRRTTVEKLEMLEKKIDDIFFNCNVVHGVGTAAGVVGGAAIVLSGILALCGQPNAAKSVFNGGSTCSTIGHVASVTTVLAEAGLTQGALNDIKQLLAKDEELTKPIREWIERSRSLDKQLKEIFGVNVMSDIFDTLVRICDECLKLVDVEGWEITKVMSDLENGVLDFQGLTRIMIPKIRGFLQRIYENPRQHKTLQRICKLLEENPTAYKFAALGVKISIQVVKSVDFIPVVTGAVGVLIKGTGSGVSMTQCFLGGISVAIDVMSVANAVKNTQEGKSSYSKSLKITINALQSELKNLEGRFPGN